MTLPRQNLQASQIRDTIGIGNENNLALYIVKAKTRGEQFTTNSNLSSPFRVVENGYTKTDGVLINHHKEEQNGIPYFNIWSSEAPAEWVYAIDTHDHSYRLLYRLKRNSFGTITFEGESYNEECYCLNLGAFGGYNHSATPPSITPPLPIDVDSDDTSTKTIELFIDLGEIDWIKAIASNKNYINRNNFYIEIKSIEGSEVSCSTGKLALEPLLQSAQSISLSTIATPELKLEAKLYEDYGGTYLNRGILPWGTAGNSQSICHAVTINCFNIPCKVVITSIELISTTTQQIEVSEQMNFNETAKLWSASFYIQYSARTYLTTSQIKGKTFTTTSGNIIDGMIQSVRLTNFAMVSSGVFKSLIQVRISPQPDLGEGNSPQNLTLKLQL